MQTSPITATHPTGLQLVFHPEPHHYLLDGNKLTSVTSLIHNWFPQFDAEAVAKKKAEREGQRFEDLLAAWDKKRDEASDFGSKVHSIADTIIREKNDTAADHLAATGREKAYLTAVKEALRRIALGYEVVDSEKIIFSPTKKVAGTVDLLLRCKKSGEHVVADWKTSREIKYQGFREEMGSGPCHRLINCNFNHYSLQTSAYGTLLTNEGYIPAVDRVRGVLLHLCEKDGRVVCDYIKTKDLASEARLILGSVESL